MTGEDVTQQPTAIQLQPRPLANAVAAVAVATYLICGIVSYVAPSLFFDISRIWFHAINIETARAMTPMPIGTFVLGVVTFGLIAWVLTYAAGRLYDRLAG